MNLVYYVGGSALTYYLSRNIASKTTDALINYVMNFDADDRLNDHHTVESISCMLKKYENMRDTNPAYESMLSVKQALQDLSDTIHKIKLKIHVHNNGYFSRFRTYDARKDNKKIQRKIDELMYRLDVFTKILKLK